MYTTFYKNNFFINENYLPLKNETNDLSTAIEDIAKCLQQQNNEQFKRESVIKAVGKPKDYNSIDSIVNSCLKNNFGNIEEDRTQAPEGELLNNDPFSYEELEYEFIVLGVKLGNIKLEDLDEFWRSNRKIVKGVLTYDKDFKNSYSSLQFASEKLQDDKEIVLIALQNFPFALQFASKRLREKLQNHEQAIVHTVKRSADALEFTSKKLRQ